MTNPVTPTVLLFLATTSLLMTATTIHNDLVFATTPQKKLTLDLCLPENVSRPPLVIYIHGGSWIQRTSEVCPVDWLTQHGFAVAAITYRFSQEAIFPAQLFDCKAAVRWLRAHAGDYGYDASRIGVIGSSAGAHLALLLGTTAEAGALEGSVGDNAGHSSRVEAVVDFFGASDFVLRAQTQPENTNQKNGSGYRLLGGSPEEKPELARLASSAFHVTPDDAPLLIFHGAKDTTVLLDQSERIRDAYVENGLEAELYVIPEGIHAMDDLMLSKENQQRIVAFLQKHLKEPRR